MQTLSEDEIRAKVEAKTGKLPEPIWRLLCEDGNVSDVEQADCEKDREDFFRDLLDRTKQLVRTFGNQPVTVAVDSEEKHDDSRYVSRTNAVSALLANHARNREDVQEFRREVLGGRVLSAEELQRWIEVNRQEPEAQDWFKKRKQVAKRKYKRLEAARKAGRSYSFSGRCEALRYVKPGERESNSVPVAAVGKLWRLKRLVSALVKDYPWDEEQAVLLALTDIAPFATASVTTNFGSFPTMPGITLGFPAWYSEADVGRLYWHARKQLRYAKMPAISRRISRLIQFVCEKKKSWESWEACRREWNEYPDTPKEWQYNTYKRMASDFARAEKSLMHPKIKR